MIGSQLQATTSSRRGQSTPVVCAANRERRLFVRYQRFGDVDARAQLIERYLPLAHHLAQRYQRPHEPPDDLVQVASVGLVKAVDRFDPSRGAAFSSFAVPTILGELKRYFRDCGWAVCVPRGTQERMLKVNAVVGHLARRLGRSPTLAEVVDASELTSAQVADAMEAAEAVRTEPLATTAGDDDGEPALRMLGMEDERFALVEDRDAIQRGLSGLSTRDRLVLHLRFAEGLTQAQVAERVGISQMQVSRVLKRTLDHVRSQAARPPTAAGVPSRR